jgi:hypothetical protein
MSRHAQYHTICDAACRVYIKDPHQPQSVCVSHNKWEDNSVTLIGKHKEYKKVFKQNEGQLGTESD